MARIRSIFKWGIFFSSYVPLYLILAYKHSSIQVEIPAVIPVVHHAKVPLVSIFWLLLTIVSLVILGTVFKIRKSKEPEPKKIQKARSRNDAITNYILVYIFPFVVLDLSQLANWVVFVSFFLVIGFIQIRSNHLFINPVLGIIGYNIYEVNTEDQQLTLLINQRIEDRPTDISAVELSNGVYIAI
ncbi:hypothetical protein [Haloarchaeobius sp. DFWS5]|uniref:hypothetical protein n=1 Tax=Haloarchaeobius sp. DFWS5 TaxID=3446114 RepID=UPI003EC0BE7B